MICNSLEFYEITGRTSIAKNLQLVLSTWLYYFSLSEGFQYDSGFPSSLDTYRAKTNR